MSKRTLLGLLTPSSNTILEPMTARILAETPDITAHFGRFRVTEISLSDDALGQFTFGPQLAAAEMLADAKVDVIAWAGTSGGWVGVEQDRTLCRQITERTGVPATTSTLALLAAFEALEVKSYGLVTPYLSDVQARILETFRKEDLTCTAERHLEDKGNFSFSEFGEDTIEALVREVAADRPQAIAIYCTNFNGTRIAPLLERELDVPILDSVAITIWHMLRLTGADTRRVKGWGELFATAAAA